MVDADLPSRDAAKEFYAKYEPKEALGRWGYRKCTPSSIPLLLRHPLNFSLALSLFLVHIYIYVCTFSQYFGTLVSVVVIWCKKKNVSLAYIALSLATLWCSFEWPSLFTDSMNTRSTYGSLSLRPSKFWQAVPLLPSTLLWFDDDGGHKGISCLWWSFKIKCCVLFTRYFDVQISILVTRM